MQWVQCACWALESSGEVLTPDHDQDINAKTIIIISFVCIIMASFVQDLYNHEVCGFVIFYLQD